MTLKARGFALTEAMIGVALLALIAAGISYSVLNGQGIDRGVRATGSCGQALATAVSKFENFGTRDHILNDLVLNSAANSPSNIGSVLNGTQVSAADSQFYTLPFTKPLIKYSAGTPSVISNSQLIFNTANVLQSLLNSNPVAYCSGSAKGQNITALFTGLPSDVTSVFLKIQLYDINKNKPLGCPAVTPVIAAPHRATPKPAPGYGLPSNNPAVDGFQIVGDSDLGYMASFTVGYTNLQKAAQICQTDKIFQFQADNVPPVAPSFTSVFNGAAPPITITGNLPRLSTSCDTDGAGWNDITAILDLAAQPVAVEPGSLILCTGIATDPNGVSYTDNLLVPCDKVYFKGGPIGLITAAVSPTSTATKLVLTFNSAGGNQLKPEFMYDIVVTAIDSAGNKSVTPGHLITGTGIPGLIMDNVRPTYNLVSDGINLGKPEDGVGGRAANGFISPYPWSKPEIQCNDLPVTMITTVAPGDFTQNIVPCKITDASSDSGISKVKSVIGGSPCIITTSSVAASVTSDNHFVAILGRDVCGPNPVPAKHKWTSIVKMCIDPTQPAPNDWAIHGSGAPFNNYAIPIAGLNPPFDPTITQCDCSGGPYANPGENTLTCIPPTNIAPNGCWAGPGGPINFYATVWDICGNFSSTTATYNVHGDVGDSCQQVSCGPGPGKTEACAIKTANGNVLGTCADVTGLPAVSACVPPMVGATGTANGCPTDSLYTCNYTSACTPIAGLPGFCGAGTLGGEACTYDTGTSGTCGAAPAFTCSVSGAAGSTACGGAGASCDSLDLGTCSVPVGSCNLAAGATNPAGPPPAICPTRGAGCTGGAVGSGGGGCGAVCPCSAATGATICVGTNYPNSCGVNSCNGTKVGTCNPATAPTVCIGSTYADSCGNVNPACVGTKSCPTPTPTPVGVCTYSCTVTSQSCQGALGNVCTPVVTVGPSATDISGTSTFGGLCPCCGRVPIPTCRTDYSACVPSAGCATPTPSPVPVACTAAQCDSQDGLGFVGNCGCSMSVPAGNACPANPSGPSSTCLGNSSNYGHVILLDGSSSFPSTGGKDCCCYYGKYFNGFGPALCP